MGRASISIAITSNFNGSGIDAAIRKADELSVKAASMKGSFGKSMVDAGAQIGIASNRLTKWGKSIADVGDKLTTYVTVPMVTAAAVAVKSAVDIDTAWYNVRKTVDMTEEGYQKLKQGAIDLSNTQPVSAETILNIESLGGQLGIANENLESFAKVVSGLEISTNLGADEAATQLAQFRNVTQMSESELDNFGSALVDLGNHTATTESDIMQLSLRFASAAHIAGMSNQDILGLSAALAGLGMKADAGGSALSQVINTISLDVAKGGEDVQKWADLVGEAPDKFAEAWRTAPTDEFIKVLEAIGADGADANKILNDLGITAIRQSDAMRRLAGSGDLVRESVARANEAWSENTALTREVENRNESLASRFETIKNRLTNTAAAFGEPIAKLTLNALDGLDPIINGVQEAATAFANASPLAQRFSFNLGLVAAAAGPVLSVGGRVMQLAGKIGTFIGRGAQQYGVFTDALNTNSVAVRRNYAESGNLAARIGLSRNAAVKAAGGIDQYMRNVRAATTVVKSHAEATVKNQAAVEGYAKALGVSGKSAKDFSGGVRSSAEAVKFATDANKRYKEALANGATSATEAAQAALNYKDNTSKSAVAANKAANEAMGYSGALKSQSKSGTAAAKAALRAAESTKTKRAATKAAAKAVQEMTDADVEYIAKTKEGQAALEKQGKAVSGVGTVLSSLKATLLGLGGMALVGGAVAGITYLVSQMQEAAERADMLDKATNGLRDALSGTGDAAKEAGDKNRSLISSFGETHQHVKTAIENQSQLADTFRQIDTQAAAQTGALDRAREAIEKYANQGNLSASEMYRLQQAIETVNSLCGTQFQVLGDGSVALETESGLVQQNTDAILANIDARKRQMQLEALESKYSEAYQNQIDMSLAHAEAVDQLAKAKERVQELNEKERLSFDEAKELQQYTLGGELEKLEQDVRDTADAFDEANNATNTLEQSIDALSGSAQDLSGDLQKLFEPTGNYYSAFEVANKGIEDNLNAFAAACQTMGLNFEALNSLGTTEIQSLATSFDGSCVSIIHSLESLGKTDILNDLGANWRASLDEASQGIADSISQNFNVSLAELGAIADDLGVKGQEASSRFVEGLQAGLSSGLGFEDATALAAEIAKSFEDALTPEQASEIARNFLENLSHGLTDSEAISNAIQQFKSTLSQVDFTAEGAQAKSTWLAGFNQGGGAGEGGTGLQPFTQGLYSELDTINNTVNEKGQVTGEGWGLGVTNGAQSGIQQGAPNIPPTVQGMLDLAWPIFEGGRLRAQTEGQGLADGYGLGFSMGGTGVQGSALELVMGAISQLTLGVTDAGQAGSDTSNSYASNIGAMEGTAVQAAWNTQLQVIASYLLGIEAARLAGQQTGEAYSSNLSTNVDSAATAVSTAVGSIMISFALGIEAAAIAGTNTGNSYAQNLSTGCVTASTVAQLTAESVGSMLATAIAPAGAAGTSTGVAFTSGFAGTVRQAVSIASSIARTTANQLGAFKSSAYSSGYALGQNFAQGVRDGGKEAVSAAQSIADRVAAILHHSTPKEGPLRDDDVWGLHFAQNFAQGIVKGTPKVEQAALSMANLASTASSPGATYRAAGYTVASRAQTVSSRALARVSNASYVAEGARESTRKAVSKTISEGSSGGDYDRLYAVVRSAMLSALERSGAGNPTIVLDGRKVSKGLVSYMDADLGELQESRR